MKILPFSGASYRSRCSFDIALSVLSCVHWFHPHFSHHSRFSNPTELNAIKKGRETERGGEGEIM